MRTLTVALSFSILIFMGASLANAYIIDGSLNDWGIDLLADGADEEGYLDLYDNRPSGGLDIDYVTEDNADAYDPIWTEVGPGWTYENYYDAEAIYFDNDLTYLYIAIVQGMPKEGHQLPSPPYSYPRFHPGDIAIDKDDDEIYEYGIDVSSFDTTNKTANFYETLTSSDWSQVYYNQYSVSNPWEINTGGDNIKDKIDFVYSDYQNTHYVLEAAIPLSYLGLTANPGDPDFPLIIHWTQECGNDYLNLYADVNSVPEPVPEPTTILLIGFGLLGLLGIGIKHRQK